VSLRFDRLTTLYFVKPLRRLAPAATAHVPILMYHSISEKDESQVHPYYRTTTTPSMFAQQMGYLHENGYRTCNVSEALDCLQEKQGSTKRVVITFDDGFVDFYRAGFPVLDHYGFRATMYVPTAYISDTRARFKETECLTWDEVRELNRHGIHFGSHTVTHPWLRELALSAVNDEISTSKKTIEDKLGCAVESFAYPYAFPQTDSNFRQMLRDSLERAGYQNGVCTILGRASAQSDRFFLERLPANSADDPALLDAKLTGAYDWLGKAQSLTKVVKSQIRNFVPKNAKPMISRSCS
jgi:peptidoglycan/xylan/chitin deacetylase (PgdA/CDA1 family)